MYFTKTNQNTLIFFLTMNDYSMVFCVQGKVTALYIKHSNITTTELNHMTKEATHITIKC